MLNLNHTKDTTMLIDSYDQGVIDVLDIYMKDCKDITLVEFGRGNGALAEKYLAEGKKVTIIEDWKQQIYQADEKYYEQYEDCLLYTSPSPRDS